jgi:hypothetical protein
MFAVRASSKDAYYSRGFKNGTTFGTVNITADAGFLSGNYFDMTNAASNKGICWSGVNNVSTTRSFSILLRFAPNYTGAPSATRVLFNLTGGAGNQGIFLELRHNVTTGALIFTLKNEANQNCFNAVSFGNWTANTAGTLYDFLLKWDGTTTANAGKLYIDNSLQGQLTAGFALSASTGIYTWNSISLGLGSNSVVAACDMKPDEFVLFDGDQDPANTALVSGNGALNGASRTSLVAASVYNGPAQYSRSRV